MAWIAELLPVMTELSILPEMSDEATMTQMLDTNIRQRFLPMFERRIGGVLLLGKTIDTAQPLLVLTWPAGFLQFAVVYRRTPYAQRQLFQMFGAFVIAGYAPRYCFVPIVSYAFYASTVHWRNYFGSAPLDMKTQRRILAYVNAVGADHTQGLMYDFSVKMSLFSGAIFSFAIRPTRSLWLSWWCGMTFGMNTAHFFRLYSEWSKVV
jgi:hypothetical protein